MDMPPIENKFVDCIKGPDLPPLHETTFLPLRVQSAIVLIVHVCPTSFLKTTHARFVVIDRPYLSWTKRPSEQQKAASRRDDSKITVVTESG